MFILNWYTAYKYGHEHEPPIKWYLTIWLVLSKEDTKKEKEKKKLEAISLLLVVYLCNWVVNEMLAQIGKRIVTHFF